MGRVSSISMLAPVIITARNSVFTRTSYLLCMSRWSHCSSPSMMQQADSQHLDCRAELLLLGGKREWHEVLAAGSPLGLAHLWSSSACGQEPPLSQSLRAVSHRRLRT